LKQKKEINRFGIVGNPWFADKALHVQSVTFSPDGKTALFGLEFGTVIWWSLDDWKEIAQNRVYEKELAYVTFSADGDYCISVGHDKSTTNKKPDAKIRFWELPNQKSIEVN
jgi:WD40 repeat protein